MADLRELLEALADDGHRRGAGEVLRRARRQLAAESSAERRGRPQRWLTAAAAIVTVVVAASALVLLHDREGDDAPIAGGNTAGVGRLGEWQVVAPARSGLDPGTRIQAIERVPGGLVAVGSVDTTAGLSTQAAWTSTDGRRWSRGWSATFGPGVLDLVTTADDGVVAVGSTPGTRGARSVWRSDDGSRWERVTSRAPGGIRSVVAGGPGLVAAGFTRGPSKTGAARTAIWTSVHGTRWSPVPERDGLFPAGRIAGLAVDGDGFVAVGTDRSGDASGSGLASVWSSPDGTTWRRVPGRAGLRDATVTPTTPIAGRDGELRMLALPSRAGTGVAGECTTPRPRHAVWGSEGGRRWGRLSRVGAAPGASHLVGSDGWWLAGGSRGACDRSRSVVYLSPDGRRWTEAGVRRDPTAGTVQAMAPTAGGAVVVVGRPRPASGLEITPEVWVWTAPEARR